MTQDVVAQPQGQLPPQAEAARYSGQQAAQNGAAAAGGDTMKQMFTDPTALLAIAATLGQNPNYGESGLGQVARALSTGNQVVVAKNYAAQQAVRQQALDAQDADKNQAELDYKNAQTASSEQMTQEAAKNADLKRAGLQSELDVAAQRIKSAQGTDREVAARAAYQEIQNRIANLTMGSTVASAGGKAASDVARGNADTQYAAPQAAANVAESTNRAASTAQGTQNAATEGEYNQLKLQTIKDLPPKDRTAAFFGRDIKSLQTDDDKFQGFVEKVKSMYGKVDPVTQEPMGLNWPAINRQYAELFPDSDRGKAWAARKMPTQAQAQVDLQTRINNKRITADQAQKWLQDNGYDSVKFQ
jgi:hypothetical protein